jgi:integrase
MAALKRIRRLGLAEMVDGKRRSLVNFHSLRRGFITAAFRAGQPERVVQQVVGHRAQGVTLGVYFAGDLQGR